AGLGNLISSNGGDGIFVGEFFRGEDPVIGNILQGNFIGTDVTGTQIFDSNNQPLGNGVNGIHIESGAVNTIIGGTTAGLGNVVAANGWYDYSDFAEGIKIA